MKRFGLFLLSSLNRLIQLGGLIMNTAWGWIKKHLSTFWEWNKPGKDGQLNTFQLSARVFGIWVFLMLVLLMVKPEWFNTWLQFRNLFILLPLILVMLMIALTPSGRPKGYRIVAGFMVAVIAELYFGGAIMKMFPGISSMWQQIHIAGEPASSRELPPKYLVIAPGETGTITIDRGYSFISSCGEAGEIIYPKHVPCGPGVNEPLGDAVSMITYRAVDTPLHVVVYFTPAKI